MKIYVQYVQCAIEVNSTNAFKIQFSNKKINGFVLILHSNSFWQFY